MRPQDDASGAVRYAEVLRRWGVADEFGTCEVRFAALGRLVILEVADSCEEQRVRLTKAVAIQDPGTRLISRTRCDEGRNHGALVSVVIGPAELG